MSVLGTKRFAVMLNWQQTRRAQYMTHFAMHPTLAGWHPLLSFLMTQVFLLCRWLVSSAYQHELLLHVCSLCSFSSSPLPPCLSAYVSFLYSTCTLFSWSNRYTKCSKWAKVKVRVVMPRWYDVAALRCSWSTSQMRLLLVYCATWNYLHLISFSVKTHPHAQHSIAI